MIFVLVTFFISRESRNGYLDSWESQESRELKEKTEKMENNPDSTSGNKRKIFTCCLKGTLSGKKENCVKKTKNSGFYNFFLNIEYFM